jgi:4-alpha-glucanotransferase
LVPKLQLVMLIHGHQPVGNFDTVYEKTFQRSYLPFVEALERHPAIRLGLHFSGPLLEWFEQHHPEFFDRLRELVARRQAELVGGGFFEPILVSIPPEDQAEQLRRMRDYLAEKFGAAPTGVWLAERVWEPHLPSVLSSGGAAYTLVDDVHFLAAGFEREQLCGDYIAEDAGHTVRVFPGLKSLRYLLPFRAPEEGIAFLREYAGRHPGGMAATGDDCEKFGAWPGTYDYCYGEGGWVERFFAAVESSSDWLVTTPPGEYVAASLPLGRADLPTASYAEMMEWVLPTRARSEFHALSEEFAARPNVLRFLHGGQWRGFFSKYAESNLLHKKMLHVSAQLRGLAGRRLGQKKRSQLELARTHLMRAQCNDAYWHGIFGGLYAPHLRTALWTELVRAETLAEEIAASGQETINVERGDFDADGCEDLYFTSRRMAALLRPNDGGTLSLLDFRTSGVTLINALQRREEAYHSHLREASQDGSGRVASIHEQLRTKEAGLDRFLRYDRWPRSLFRLLLFPAGKTLEDYQALRLEEHAGLAGEPYTVRESGEGRVSLVCEVPSSILPSGTNSPELLCCAKSFSFAHEDEGYRIDCAVELNSAGAAARTAQVGIEVVLNLLAANEPDRYFDTGTARHPLQWTAALPAPESQPLQLRAVDEWQNVAVTLEAPGASQAWVAPIETVSESEEGFERVYQGSQILIVWPAELAIGSVWRAGMALRVGPAHHPTPKSPSRS